MLGGLCISSTSTIIEVIEEFVLGKDEAVPNEAMKKQVKFTLKQYVSLAKSWIRILNDNTVKNSMKEREVLTKSCQLLHWKKHQGLGLH